MDSATWLIEKFGIGFYCEYCMWRGKGGFGIHEALNRIRDAHRCGYTPHSYFR